MSSKNGVIAAKNILRCVINYNNHFLILIFGKDSNFN